MTIQNPLFQPPSEWVCPEYIDYKGQSPVAIDLETYDPGIKDHGPGWATGNGKVVGVAIAWDGFKGYFPIDHDAPGNYDKKVFMRQFQDLLRNKSVYRALNPWFALFELTNHKTISRI